MSLIYETLRKVRSDARGTDKDAHNRQPHPVPRRAVRRAHKRVAYVLLWSVLSGLLASGLLFWLSGSGNSTSAVAGITPVAQMPAPTVHGAGPSVSPVPVVWNQSDTDRFMDLLGQTLTQDDAKLSPNRESTTIEQSTPAAKPPAVSNNPAEAGLTVANPPKPRPDFAPDARTTPDPSATSGGNPDLRLRKAGGTYIRQAAIAEDKTIRLDAIIWSAHNPMALMNGEAVSPGSSIHGARITKIKTQSVSIVHDGVTYILRLR